MHRYHNSLGESVYACHNLLFSTEKFTFLLFLCIHNYFRNHDAEVETLPWRLVFPCGRPYLVPSLYLGLIAPPGRYFFEMAVIDVQRPLALDLVIIDLFFVPEESLNITRIV